MIERGWDLGARKGNRSNGSNPGVSWRGWAGGQIEGILSCMGLETSSGLILISQ